MSTSNDIPESTEQPTEQSTATPDAPPDDFGAEVLAEFQRRGFGEGGAVLASDEVEPVAMADVGDWPGGATVAATPESPETSAAEAPAIPEAPATSEAPEAGTVEAPASGVPIPVEDESDPAPEAPTSEPPSVSGYTWSEGDQSVDFSDDQVREGLTLSAWARSLSDETRAAFAGIEQGAAVAVPRDEYASFQAWRDQQQRDTRDSDLADLSDVDPDVAKLISGLRDEVSSLKAAAAPQPAASQSIGDANLDATFAAMEAATKLYGAEYGLTDEQVNQLTSEAVSLNVIPALSEQSAQRNPVTGALLRPGDPAAIMRQALDMALVRNPAIRAQVMGQVNAAPTVDTDAVAPDSTDAALNSKKARASSVSTAPSAAVTSNARPSTMTPNDIVEAMANDLAAVLGGR